MATEFGWEKIDGAEIIQSLTAIAIAPIILPLAATELPYRKDAKKQLQRQ